MKTLPTAKRAEILRCLVEGNSAASTCRIVGVALNTVLDLMKKAGEACTVYQHKHLVNLPCKTLQFDEIWSFVGCKEKTKPFAKREHPGDIWTWKCLCADTKLIASWHVGDRTLATCFHFCHDLRHRFAGPVQITTDGHNAYPWAVINNFREKGLDFAQLVKVYEMKDGWDVCVGAKKMPVFGNPDEAKISTSFIERANLTLRMQNRRFTRKTNGYSKKLDNHKAMLAIGFMHYNFCRRHATIKQTPAQAAGVSDHQWTLDEIIQMMDDHFASVEREAFEAAFSAIDSKCTAPRRKPRTYPPTPKHLIPLPWYLNSESDGPPQKPQSI